MHAHPLTPNHCHSFLCYNALMRVLMQALVAPCKGTSCGIQRSHRSTADTMLRMLRDPRTGPLEGMIRRGTV